MRQPLRNRNTANENTRLIDADGRPAGGVVRVAVVQDVDSSALDTEARIQQERLNGIRDIDAETKETRALFADFKLMVDSQQEGLNKVEGNVEASTAKVEGGNVHLKQASEVQKSNRKLMCGLIVCVFVVAAVVVGVLVAMKKIG
jgi:t-SNARE complex subunit (syntaxin)